MRSCCCTVRAGPEQRFWPRALGGEISYTNGWNRALFSAPGPQIEDEHDDENEHDSPNFGIWVELSMAWHLIARSTES
jgi:hypothetical protein